ncbi:hypothetical protein [Terrisporobacter glycolicus]|uniref:ACT domain-containing protein n=1 Tax=Terrisporobacter glycolicus ATCC 14880 = DSM 1288 TaxID=1121315 RepID=A0ABZ2EZ33_9FIRM|nr:hypothetical protein [Terrisporobacter glycolicus]
MNKDKNLINKVNSSNANNSSASIVVQFTVYTSEEYLSALLNTLGENNLNISAYYMSENNRQLKFVFIVGEDDVQSSSDVNITRSILKQNRFNFDETKVVRLSTPNNVGLLAYHYSELIRNLTIYNSYIGEDGSIIYETCCPTKTLKAVNELY